MRYLGIITLFLISATFAQTIQSEKCRYELSSEPGDLQVSVALDEVNWKAHNFSVKLLNTSADKAELQLAPNDEASLIIYDAEQNILWQNPASETKLLEANTVSLEDGETISYSFSWNGLDQTNDSVGTGEFCAIGVIRLEDATLYSEPINFTVEPQ